MQFGMSLRIKPKGKYDRISMNEIWRNLDGPPNINRQILMDGWILIDIY